MKEKHHQALSAIEERFGELEAVEDPDSGWQVGWKATMPEERVSFNFTADAIRLFHIEKQTEKSKYKGLELLRQCAKKSGLEKLVYYDHDPETDIGMFVIENAPADGDGLEQIKDYYKVGDLEKDGQGGGYVRVGSRLR